MRVLLPGTVAGIVVAVLAAVPAHAHPDIDNPQTVDITRHGNEVVVTWQAPSDELGLLAVELDLIPPTRTFVYENGHYVAEESDLTDTQLLVSNADRVGDYLVDALQIRSGGAPCSGELADISRIDTAGVQLVYTCPDEAGAVEVTPTAFTEVDARYETAVVVDSRQVARATADAPTLELRFDDAGTVTAAAPPSQVDIALTAALAGASVVLIGIAALVILRRRRRARTS